MTIDPLTTMEPTLIAESRNDEFNSDMNLVDLEGMLKFVENEISQNNIDRGPYDAFMKLLYNMNLCIVTGSAVLNHRLGNQNQSGDIDLFISGKDSQGIVETFFTYYSTYGVFTKFRDEKCNIRPEVFRSENLEIDYRKTNINGYSFIKGDSSLELYRFGTRSPKLINFNLNFIYVGNPISDINGSEMSGFRSMYLRSYFRHYSNNIGSEPLGYTSFKAAFPSQFNLTTNPDSIRMVYNDFPMAVALHYINTVFDFEELKYVYCFELRQAIPAVGVGRLLMVDYRNKVLNYIEHNLVSGAEFNQFLIKLNRTIEQLDDEAIEFQRLTSDPKVLSISPVNIYMGDSLAYNASKSIRRISSNDQDVFLNPITDVFNGEPQLMESLKRASVNLVNIKKRIIKYKEKGFDFKDPKDYLLNLKSAILYNTISTLNDDELESIIVSNTLLSGDAAKVRKLSILRTSRKAFDDITATNNIRC